MRQRVLEMMLVAISLAVSSTPAAEASSEKKPVELFAEDFSTYPLAERMDVKTFGQRLGPWQLMTLHFSWHSRRYNRKETWLPFRIIARDGRRFLDQPESFSNVVIKAGRPQWRDYVLELDLAVNDGPAGPIVRYATSRRNYWVCFQTGQPVKLLRRDQDDYVQLGVGEACQVQKDRLYHCQVACDGPRISVAVDSQPLISVKDGTFSDGQIALRTDGPSRFAAIKVWAEPAEADRIAAEVKGIEARVVLAAQAMPPTKLIHSVVLPGKPDSMRVRDLNDDGVPEIMAAYVLEAGARRVAVFDWNGKPMWTLEPSASASARGGPASGGEGGRASAGFLNAADIDADGHTEIIGVRGPEIVIVDGATGRVKRSAPAPMAEQDKEPVRLDACLVCNLRGLTTPRDLIVKDEYTHMWAYTDEFQPLWDRALNIGHYPRARDINGDGKDEVMAGYSMLAADGHTLWTVPGGDPVKNLYPGSEHADAMLIERFGPEPDAPLRIAMAASDLGFIFMDVNGRVLAQHRIGHAQWISASRFRPDLPGRQIVVGTFWGNSNIINLFDCNGNLLMIREMSFGPPVPVYWLGSDAPLFAVLSWAAGLWNRDFDRVLRVPGEITVPPFACDVNGDGLDELLTRDGNKLLVYAPEGIKAAFKAPPANRPNWFVPCANSYYR
jgi:hypothetical protein